MKKRRKSCVNLCLLSTGLLFIILSLTIFIYFEPLYDTIITSALHFSPNSKSFAAWRINDPPIPLSLYLFNWTNPEDIGNPNIKPRFEQVGPYAFKEVHEKINITWNFENDTITYGQKKTYFYDPENSVRNMDQDVITILNPVALSVAYKARDFSFFGKKSTSFSLAGLSRLYVRKAVREILFDGYYDSLLDFISRLPMTNVKDRFGFFYGRNGTTTNSDFLTMHIKTDKDFGKLMAWNYRNNTNFYDTPCNEVRGSSGEFYPINRQRDYIEIFSGDLCKVGRLQYEKDVVVKGIKGYKYTAKNIFDNGETDKANACYCTDECLPNGVLNVSQCREGSPTFLSLPHFYNADKWYVESVEGMKPNDNHEFYITLEPKSGIIIDIAARIQVNLLLQPIDDISMYERMPKILFPIFYFEQTAIVNDDLAKHLLIIQNLPEISNIIVLILIATGLLLLVWFSINIYCFKRERENLKATEYKITQNSPEEIPLYS